MSCNAAVIGAGIGGLCTAIGLRQAGWSVTVLERWPQIVGAGAALGVWPEARDGLVARGLGEDFDAHSVPVAAAAVYSKGGRALLRIPDDSKRIPAVRLISRRRLMDLLVERADGVEIRTGERADERTLRALAADADLLVGADGLRSEVRSAFFGARTQPRFSGLVGWRGSVPFESGQYGETWGEGMLFGNTPMAPGYTNFYAALRAPETDRLRLPELRARFTDWREPIPAILAAAWDEDLLRNPIFDLHPPLRSFVTGNVALLGDAAHAMTPHAGRGACEAINDATSLVRQLGTVGDVTAALNAYDRERRRAAQRIAARSWRIGRLSHARGAPAATRNALVRAAGIFVR